MSDTAASQSAPIDPAAHLLASEEAAWSAYRGRRDADPVARDNWRRIIREIEDLRGPWALRDA